MSGWAPLEALRTVPFRTGSLISTIYGDAILPRGGTLAVASLLALLRHLGIHDGVVRTALSRLARDGVLAARRTGRHSAYSLTAAAETEFRNAVPRIYGTNALPWNGRLHMAFPEPGADRTGLDRAGFALLSPGVLIAPSPTPPNTPALEATGTAETIRLLAARAWPLDRLGALYAAFATLFAPLDAPAPTPLDAMAARTLLIHSYRRIALRDPRLPAPLLPRGWQGHAALALCVRAYAALAPASEAWLDTASSGAGPLPPGPDPVLRFTSSAVAAGPRPGSSS